MQTTHRCTAKANTKIPIQRAWSKLVLIHLLVAPLPRGLSKVHPSVFGHFSLIGSEEKSRRLTASPHVRQIIRGLIFCERYVVKPLVFIIPAHVATLGRSLTPSSRACGRAKRLSPPENWIVFLPIFHFCLFLSPELSVECLPARYKTNHLCDILVHAQAMSPLAVAYENYIVLHFLF